LLVHDEIEVLPPVDAAELALLRRLVGGGEEEMA
jgi:glutaconate CoA-transferase subunit B